MPYKSDAQRRYFHAAEARGEISSKTVKEFDKASKGKELPEKVEHKAHGGTCFACGGEVPHDHPANVPSVEHYTPPEIYDEPHEGAEGEPEHGSFAEHLAGHYALRRAGAK